MFKTLQIFFLLSLLNLEETNTKQITVKLKKLYLKFEKMTIEFISKLIMYI